MTAFSQDFVSGIDFEGASAIFCSYDYCENVSEAVEKIPADEKDHQNCYLWYIKTWLLGLLRRSKKSSEHTAKCAKKNEQ